MIKYVIMAVAAVAVAGCASARPKDTVVNVGLWDSGSSMAMITDRDNIPAGKVTFRGTNISTDDVVHEMLVVKVDTNLPNLPYNESDGRVPEDKIHSLGEISELEPGRSNQLTLNLKPGTYLLFCNRPGHFASHMKTLLHVK